MFSHRVKSHLDRSPRFYDYHRRFPTICRALGGRRLDERWHSVEGVCEHLGVARDTVYRWIERRGLPAHKIGKLWKFRLSEVDAWVVAGGADEVGAHLPPHVGEKPRRKTGR